MNRAPGLSVTAIFLLVGLVAGATRYTGTVSHGHVSTFQTPSLFSSSPPSGLVVGGSNAKSSLRKKLAHVVVQTRNGDVFSCTGSVIAPRFVLCAAHCFIFGSGKENRVYARRSYVLIGEKETDIKYFELPSNKYFMKHVYVHKKYEDNGYFRYDVAIVELKSSIATSLYSPMRLGRAPGKGGKRVIVSGYGVRGSFKQAGKKVKQAKVLFQKWNVCNEELGFSGANSEREEVCSTSVGFPNKGKTGICFGDSGGPIMIKSGSEYRQYGIASFFYGNLCESAGTVFVHQKVAFFLRRIEALVSRDKKRGWRKIK